MLKYILAAVLFATPAAANPVCKAQAAYANFVMAERQSGTSFLDMIDAFTTSFSRSMSGTTIANMLTIQVAAYRIPIVTDKQKMVTEFSAAVYKACEATNT